MKQKKLRELTDSEIETAFQIWYRSYAFQDLDQEITPYLSDELRPFKLHQPGWLRKVRLSLFLSTLTLAEKLGITRSAYARCEIGEESGAITLATLSKMAEAMNCELVYAIRPKNKRVFSDSIWKTLLKIGQKDPWLKGCDQKRRGNALASVAKRNMEDPSFRRAQGWSQRANSHSE